MAKVKIGDRVRMVVTHDNARKGEEGIVIATLKHHRTHDLLIMFDDLDLDKHSGWSSGDPDFEDTLKPFPTLEERKDRCQFVNYAHVKLAKQNFDEFSKLVVYAEHNKVIAKLLNGKRTVATGVAKCSPSDTFDFLKGAQIAVQRCMVEVNNTPIVLDGEAVKRLGITTTL